MQRNIKGNKLKRTRKIEKEIETRLENEKVGGNQVNKKEKEAEKN